MKCSFDTSVFKNTSFRKTEKVPFENVNFDSILLTNFSAAPASLFLVNLCVTSGDQYWSKVCGMVLKFLTLMFLYTMEIFTQNINVSIAQSVEWRIVDLEVMGSYPATAVNFLFDISIIWGNEPNGEQEQQQEEQLK